jgi:cytochrome o ubiquinol oxidase subunit 1
MLNERLGKQAFWIWLIGFFVSFIPLYLLGLMGANRRLDHYSASTGWQPLFAVSNVGFLIITWAICVQIYQLIVSIRDRNQNRDLTGDPWNGRTLEWSTPSPPPFYNFAVIPTVTSPDAFWKMKKEGWQPDTHYKDIVLPQNTGMGIYISIFCFFFCFAMVWHLFWLAALGLIGAIACVTAISFDDHRDYVLPAAKLTELEKGHP